MPFSIRSRVVLLVLAVLLPGMLGFGWVLFDTYAAERQAHERSLRDTARALAQRVDGELLRRATIAGALAQSSWLDTSVAAGSPALLKFEQQARRAMMGLEGWIEIRDSQRVLVDTRGADFLALDRSATPPQALAERMRIEPLSPRSGTGEAAHAAVVHPVERDGRVLYELTITILPMELQRIVDALQLAPGSVGTIIDSRFMVVARYPGGKSHVGQPVRPELQALMREQEEGLFNAVSLDGQPSTAYFSRAPLGWSFVAGMPEERFAGYLPGTVRRIALGALLLLALAIAGALVLARRIVEPVLSLKQAVRQLRNQEPIEVRSTGVIECDEVTVALAEAAETTRHARADLERQVGEAVQRTRLAEQRAAQNQRVAAVGRLTGGVAHDFNNLLGVISNSAHLIQRHPAAGDLAAPLAATQRAVETGSQLTQHLLRFSGRRPLRPQWLRLREALPEMQDLLRSVLGGRIAVSVQVAADTRAIHIDASELELALINLALNARDAMPNGGELRLWARNADADDLAESADLPPGGYVLISVVDDGSGLAPDVAAHAFEPFFTTKADGQGNGLGLSQVHGFCQQAGGSVRIASTPGLGTAVMLLLPAADAQPPAPQAQDLPGTGAAAAGRPPPAAEVNLGGASVLLVEDNQVLADTTEALLVAHGARVARAGDALQAMRRIDAGMQYDMVLSDVMMPGAMDGLALARELRALHPSLPVVLITALGQAAAGAEGEFKVLHKPCPQPQLLAAVREAIDLAK